MSALVIALGLAACGGGSPAPKTPAACDVFSAGIAQRLFRGPVGAARTIPEGAGSSYCRYQRADGTGRADVLVATWPIAIGNREGPRVRGLPVEAYGDDADVGIVARGGDLGAVITIDLFQGRHTSDPAREKAANLAAEKQAAVLLVPRLQAGAAG